MTLTFADRLSTLLAKGYFPKELPPPFSTASFANKIAAVGVVAEVLGEQDSHGESIGLMTYHDPA